MTVLRSEGRATLAYALGRDGFTIGELARHFGIHEHSVRKQLRRMESRGILRSALIGPRLLEWQIVDRGYAQDLVDEKPLPHNGYIPVSQRQKKAPVRSRPVSFVFDLGVNA